MAKIACSVCGHTEFIVYRVSKHTAHIALDGTIELFEEQTSAAVDEILCAKCNTHLWDGSVLGTLEPGPQDTFELPEDVRPKRIA